MDTERASEVTVFLRTVEECLPCIPGTELTDRRCTLWGGPGTRQWQVCSGETLSHHVRKLHVRSWSYYRDSPNGSLGNNHINIQSVVYLSVGRGFWHSDCHVVMLTLGEKGGGQAQNGAPHSSAKFISGDCTMGLGFITTESRSTSFAVFIFLILIVLRNPFSIWPALSLENTDLPNLPWFISLIVMYLKLYPV